MTKSTLFTILLLGVFHFSIFSQNNTNDLDPKKYFDFWVGNWEVTWERANGSKGKGVNVIEKTLDNKVIQENFTITEGKQAGFKGTSISVYQPRKQVWKQAWADNQGGYYDFTGRIDGEKRIFQTALIEREDGSKFTQRMVFYDITQNSFNWDWESSNDGGENWKLQWRIHYKRIQE